MRVKEILNNYELCLAEIEVMHNGISTIFQKIAQEILAIKTT
jgi:hypothetical protein